MPSRTTTGLLALAAFLAASACGDDDDALDATLADRAPLVDAAGPRTCPPACGDGEVCEFMGCISTVGLCFEAPGNCSLDFEPVCGCDGITYLNPCRRALAGARHAHRGQCSNECVMTPPAGCCFDRGDCVQGLECFGASCAAGSEGRCHQPAPLGSCWVDKDCGTQRCIGAQICPCGMTCGPDALGTCGP